MWTDGGHLLDGHGLGEMRTDPGDRLGHPLHSGLGVPNLRESIADRRAQQTNQYLVDDERTEQIGFLGLGHQIEQARHRLDDVIVRGSDVQPTVVGRFGDAPRVDARGELSHAGGIQVHVKPRYGSLRLARVTWLEIGRPTAKTSMCAGSYSNTSLPSITTLAPCAATHSAGPRVA